MVSDPNVSKGATNPALRQQTESNYSAENSKMRKIARDLAVEDRNCPPVCPYCTKDNCARSRSAGLMVLGRASAGLGPRPGMRDPI
jgi:hypothetical protein